MRILYHFPTSPFARRVRLALAHKGLEHELRDARGNPAYMEELRAKGPLKTVPVLVDGDAVIGDSTSIVHYLDRAYTGGAVLWPSQDAALAFEIAGLVDVALNTLVDLGARYFVLRDSPGWPGVKQEMLDRAQRALDGLGARVEGLGRPTISRAGWSAADMSLYTAAFWLASLPARASASVNVAQILSLGWSLPTSLKQWADAHADRAEVRALDV